MAKHYLKKCPFCGKKDAFLVPLKMSGKIIIEGYIYCDYCKARGSTEYTEAEIVMSWNDGRKRRKAGRE